MAKSHSKYAFVRVINENETRIVPVSTDKPDIPDDVVSKWQKIVDITARIMGVPTGLITRFTDEVLEVFIASDTKGNPYKRFDKDTLGIGMFCETVAGQRQQMLVQDTNESDYWRTNPHAALGMKSYMGVPIEWEDGELFGTFCLLNDKTNSFTADFQALLSEFKDIIETDLKNILITRELEHRLSANEMYIREVHHRVKNHFNLLISLINMQSRETDKDIESVMEDLEHRVRAIAIVHEKLQVTGQTGEISLPEYITQLCELHIAGTGNADDISLTLDMAPITLSLSKTVPLGILISELLSNSIKYAFPETARPEIHMSIQRLDGDKLAVNYGDNGKGYPDNFNPQNTDSLGMTLISILTKQLGGVMEIWNNDGASYRTEFTV
ncbi:MAG: GAF domain-containing protein [Spirochaetales bacterium]|nr:GAF domain-containing protein [Spirochaetales bacterium]